jgi:hypothetical protein
VQKWEYGLVHIEDHTPYWSTFAAKGNWQRIPVYHMTAGILDDPFVLDFLQSLGNEGWEMFAITSDKLIFKRATGD